MREDESGLIPLAVVAKMTHRHPATLRKLLAEGKIDALKIGRDWLFTERQAAAIPPRRRKP